MKVFAIKCLKCNEVIYSRAPHDFHYCHCGSCAIDGGQGGGCISVHGKREHIATLSNYEIAAKDLKELYDDWNTGADKYGWES